MELLTQRHEDKIQNVLSCYDRVLIRGTLPHVCYAQGMTSYFYRNNIRIFDYPKWANTFRDQIRSNAESIAGDNGISIEFVRKSSIRKESLIAKVLKKRGNHPGLVHIISAMEACPSYYPWHNKETGRTSLRGTTAKCLHFYFYFIDEVLGLCHVRVPTWAPFSLQLYFNGHGYLANAMSKANIKYTQLDNAFICIDDIQKAQQLADDITGEKIHDIFDKLALYCCPAQELKERYHWSIAQAEYSTDITFKRQKDLKPIYDSLIHQAIYTVKPDKIATFLGRKLNANYQDELGNDFSTRIQGTRIKHMMGSANIKMYDKFGLILRIETTVNDVSFFKHYRKVEHRDGSVTKKYAPMKKSIYNLAPLREAMLASNTRYIEFLSSLTDTSTGIDELERISQSIKKQNRSWRGLNFFLKTESKLLQAVAAGEFMINGITNKGIRKKISNLSCSQISRLIKRLRILGVIRKVAKGYKYYLTQRGKKIITTAMKIKEFCIIPALV